MTTNSVQNVANLNTGAEKSTTPVSTTVALELDTGAEKSTTSIPITEEQLQEHWKRFGFDANHLLALQRSLDQGGIAVALVETLQAVAEVSSNTEPMHKRVLKTGGNMSIDELRVTLLEELRPHTEAIITWIVLFVQNFLHWFSSLSLGEALAVFVAISLLLAAVFRCIRLLLGKRRRHANRVAKMKDSVKRQGAK